MRCLYCRKRIGLLRRLRDSRFCCEEHRQITAGSARALREVEDQTGYDDFHVPSWRNITQTRSEDKTERRPGHSTTVFATLAVVFLLLALSQLPVGGPPTRSGSVSTLPDGGPNSGKGGFLQSMSNMIQSKTSSTLHEDFKSGMGNWEGFQSAASWNTEAGQVRPASLRLWKPSTSLVNYEMEFMGRIEHKGIDWAFRATDLRNYYATKLIITKPGPLPNAGLVRFIVLDGRERERVELPLPLTLDRGVDYRVRLSVRGDRFLTSVNGQLVSSWTDSRLSRGGVGFFTEDGESSLVKWVSVSERDSFLGRIVSAFSLISFPTAPGYAQ